MQNMLNILDYVIKSLSQGPRGFGEGRNHGTLSAPFAPWLRKQARPCREGRG